MLDKICDIVNDYVIPAIVFLTITTLVPLGMAKAYEIVVLGESFVCL